ncbi:hypothetical protein MAR_037678, partial [Mya arenaria]
AIKETNSNYEFSSELRRLICKEKHGVPTIWLQMFNTIESIDKRFMAFFGDTTRLYSLCRRLRCDHCGE